MFMTKLLLIMSIIMSFDYFADQISYAVNFLESGYIHVFGNSYFQSFRGYRGFEVFPSTKLTKEEHGILGKVLSSLE